MKARVKCRSLRGLPVFLATTLSPLLPARDVAPLPVDSAFFQSETKLDVTGRLALMRPLFLSGKTRSEIKEDRDTGAWSAYFFEAQTVDGLYPLIHVGGPCLILLEWVEPDRISLSISDPGLDLSPDIGLARNLSVALDGTWQMRRATAGVQLRPGSDRTILTFFISHGQNFNVHLERTGSRE